MPSLHSLLRRVPSFSFFFFNDTATTEIYTLSLHDALPISSGEAGYFSFQLQPQQNGRYDFGRQAAARDQAVDIAGIETHLVEQVVTRARLRRSRLGYNRSAELLENVLRALDQLRSLFDKRVTAP